MQILIIGKTAKSGILARKIKEYNPEAIIFIAPGNQAIEDYATCVDIQSNNVEDLVDFALANEIDITIVCDDEAIESEVVEAFNESGLMIFGPEKESARFAISKSVGKRFMYKLKMQTPKFGIFDKENSAREYLKNSTYPILIKADKHDFGERIHLCLSEREANTILNKLFATEDPKVVIENYVSGREFSFYAITDGYNAMPICAVVPYKYASEKDGGSITNGIGAYAPANFVDEEIINKIINTIIYPVLTETEKSASPYIGILGVDLILDENNELFVIEFNTFINEPDIECILELLDEDIISLFRACSVGSLADDYEQLKIKNLSSISIILTKTPEYLFDDQQDEIKFCEEIDENIKINYYNTVNKNNTIKAKNGRVLSLTTSACTLGQAKNNLSNWVDCITFKGKKFRKDILDNINER